MTSLTQGKSKSESIFYLCEPSLYELILKGIIDNNLLILDPILEKN